MRVLIVGGCLGLGSLVAQALLEHEVQFVGNGDELWRSNNPHHVTAEQVGLFCGTAIQFAEATIPLGDLWRDRVDMMLWLLGEPAFDEKTARPSLAPASPIPHVRGMCMV